MKHYIIVKFVEGTDVDALIDPVKAIFERTLEIPGIHSVEVKRSNSDRANRYDLMIEMDMDRQALSAYDVSEPHRYWKSEYGAIVEKKAIFDCD